MFKQVIFSILFQFIPEGLALTYLSLIFLNKKTKLHNVLLIGCISGGTTFLFRILPLSFIMHTILAFLILTLIINHIYKINIIDCFIAVLKSFIILGILELISINIFIKTSGIELKQIMNNFLLKTLAILLHITLMFITGFIIKHIKKRKDEKSIVSKNG